VHTEWATPEDGIIKSVAEHSKGGTITQVLLSHSSGK